MLELLGNLLDNAFRHARSQLRLTASRSGDRVMLVVEDDGPGIDPAARAQALQRGVRLDEIEGGHGLGLAIVGDIAALYGGGLTLGSSDLGGLRAQVTLPGRTADVS
jgi:signal transduction histidine kinase